MSRAAVLPAQTTYSLIPIGDIRESTSNPRKRFGDLDELAASIRQVGILEPLIARPRADALAGYELVAGARRFRAAQLAGLDAVPCLVRTLTDREVLEIQVTENLQRKDVHPLEEADAYHALMQADRAYTVEAVAARVARSTSYVYQRLRLLQLIPAAREAFEAEEITAAHAVRLARLSPADQARGLDECFYELFRASGDREVAPVGKLEDWIAAHTKVDVAEREVVEHYLPELHQQLAAEPEPAASLLQLSDAHAPGHYLGDKQHGLIGRGRWKEVRSEKACPHVQRGVVVHGGPLRVLTVCAKKGCPKHWPAEKKTKAAKTGAAKPVSGVDRWKAEEEKRRRERERFQKLQPRVLMEAAKTYRGRELDDALLRQAVQIFTFDEEVVERALVDAAVPVDLAHAGQVLAFALSADRGLWNLEDLRKYAKRHNLDLKAIEKQLDAEEKAAASPAAPAKKKGRAR